MTIQRESYVDLSHCKEALRVPDTVYTFRRAQDKLYAEDIEHLKTPVCNSEQRDNYVAFSADEMSDALGASPVMEEMQRKKAELTRRAHQSRISKRAAAVAAAHGVPTELQRSLSAPSVAASPSVPPISSFVELTQLPSAAHMAANTTSSASTTARSVKGHAGEHGVSAEPSDIRCSKTASSTLRSARQQLEATKAIHASQINNDTFGPCSSVSVQGRLEDADDDDDGADGETTEEKGPLPPPIEQGSAPLSHRGLGCFSSRKVSESSCLSSRSSAAVAHPSVASARARATATDNDSAHAQAGNASCGTSHSSTSRAFRVLEQALVADAQVNADHADVDRAATTKALRVLRDALQASKSAPSLASTASGGGPPSISTASAASTIVAAAERYQVGNTSVGSVPSLSSDAHLEACLVSSGPVPKKSQGKLGHAVALPNGKPATGLTQARRPASATAARANRRANSEAALPLRAVVYTPHQTTFKIRPTSAQPRTRPRSAP